MYTIKLKFLKKVNGTKYYSFRYITNTISLSINYKPELKIYLSFDYNGIQYDQMEFTSLSEFLNYSNEYIKNGKVIYFISSNNNLSNYVNIVPDNYIHTSNKQNNKEIIVKRIELYSYNFPYLDTKFNYIGQNIWRYFYMDGTYYCVSKNRPKSNVAETDRVKLLYANKPNMDIRIGDRLLRTNPKSLPFILEQISKELIEISKNGWHLDKDKASQLPLRFRIQNSKTIS